MIYKLLLLANIIFSAAAQFMLKFGMQKIGLVQVNAQIWEKLKKMAVSPYLWLAIVFFGLSFILYGIVISKMELSRSYPIALLGAIILISVISIFFFHETFDSNKIIGLTLFVGGLIFLLI